MNEHERMALKASAIRQGCAAIVYMASAAHEDFIRLSAVQHHTPDTPLTAGAEDVFDEVLARVNEAMNAVGDYMSNCDAVSEDDERATTPAFEAVQSACGIPGPPTPE